MHMIVDHLAPPKLQSQLIEGLCSKHYTNHIHIHKMIIYINISID